MREKIKIKDGSGDRDFFTIVPNYILNHSTSTDQSLYLQMKRYAGEDGKCFATQETIMNKLGIGVKAYRKSLEYLIKRGWIEFVGLSGGKTRPIKTYKINNIWQENSEYYKKIPSKRTLSKDTSQKEIDTSPKHNKIPAESAIEEEPVKEEPLTRTTTAQSADIPVVIDLFKEVNPSYQRLFGMPPQRAAAARLLKTHGLEKLEGMIAYLPRSNATKYAPTITTPAQFEARLGELIAWSQKQKDIKKATVAFV